MWASIILTKKGVKRAKIGGVAKIIVFKQWVNVIFQAFYAVVYGRLNYFLS